MEDLVKKYTVSEPWDVGVKRLHVPGFVVETKCPGCGKSYSRDMGDNALYYPKVGTPSLVHFCCEDETCEEEWQVKVKVTISLELAKE